MNKKELKQLIDNTDTNEELKYHIKLKEYYKTKFEYHSKMVSQLQTN